MRLLPPRRIFDGIVSGTSAGTGIGAAQQPPTVINIPGGNELLYELRVFISGEFNASANGSAVITDGIQKFVRSLRVFSLKHKLLWDSIPGIVAHRVESFERGTRPDYTAPANANDGATFDMTYRIPFARDHSKYRENDTILDMLNTNLELQIQFGIVTDIFTGGTAPEIINLRVRVEGIYGMNPAGDSRAIGAAYDLAKLGDFPIRQPWFGKTVIPITATETRQIEIPSGDRAYTQIFLMQQASDTLLEVTDILDTKGEITLRNDAQHVVDRARIDLLMSDWKGHKSLEAKPTAWVPIDFDKLGLMSHWLDAFGTPQGKCVLEVPVTYVANRQLVVVYKGVQAIPEGALR